MATKWPEKRRLMGTKITRLDGPEKATGRAKYSMDMNLPGMLHAMILRCPYAHATVVSIDTSAAEKAPGFKALYMMTEVGKELYFAGEEVVALAADSEEHCIDALRLINVKYKELPHQVREEDVLKQDAKTSLPVGPEGMKDPNNKLPTQTDARGKKIEDGFKDAEVTAEGHYGVPCICHQCLEPHGLVAAWNQDQTSLTIYASIQATYGLATELARRFRLPPANVTCITHHMGGGYGSKFTADPQGIAACELARKAKAPVKLMLDRAEEVVIGGTRPSAFGKVKIGAKKDGTIVAYEVDCWGTGGTALGRTVNPLPPYVYIFPSSRARHTILRTNAAQQRAMRAPSHPQSCFLTDCAIDDLAAKLGMDPLQVRLKNLPPSDQPDQEANPQAYNFIRNQLYKKEIEIAAGLMRWKEKWHLPGQGKGFLKHGVGMAIHTWGGQASPQRNECTVIISRDGSVTAKSSTQDLGTGQRTVTAIVVAEILGLSLPDINVKIGETPFGQSSGSGGSTTCPSQAPATLQAVAAAKDELFDKIAGKLGSKKEDLALEGGKVVDKKSGKNWAWKEACARLGMEEAKGLGAWTFAESQKKENRGISLTGVGGVQMAEVTVDPESGVVRCTKIVAVQDCGLIVDKLTCESQVAGGVIMGLNYALFEERIMDRVTGRQVNPDMEFYKLGGIKDMPQIVVHMHDMPERGVIGIGEPPTISTHAAISNAIFNAIGVRVPETPFTPDRVLAALAKKGGKKL
jgi:xanthine dehydrogenase YagR molybdenum-binding subunit